MDRTDQARCKDSATENDVGSHSAAFDIDADSNRSPKLRHHVS